MLGARASRANFHVSVLTELLGERWRKALRLATTLISIGIIGLLAWLTTQEAVYATGIGETSYGIYPFPIWPERIIVAIGFILLTVQLIADVIRTVTGLPDDVAPEGRSEEHTSELQSLMRISYAVFCLKKKNMRQ